MAFTYHTILTSQIPHGSLAAAHRDWDLAILCWVEIWHTCTCGLCGVCQRDLSCWSPFTTCLCINHILQEPLNTTTVPWLTTAAVTKEKGWIKCVDVLMIHWCNFLKICNIQYPGQRIATFVIWGWYISSLVILSSSFQSPRTPCSLKWGEFYHVSFILWQVCVCVCVRRKEKSGCFGTQVETKQMSSSAGSVCDRGASALDAGRVTWCSSAGQ